MYYLSNDGMIDAHIYSKGLQCVINHVHYPTWRIDFDINDSNNDQIQQDTVTGYQVKTIEFNAAANSAINHGWNDRLEAKFNEISDKNFQCRFDSS